MPWQDTTGERVLGNWENRGFWFPGTVHQREGDATTVVYDDGMIETLPASRIRAYDWQVGTRIEGRWRGGDSWYPGRIGAIDGIRVRIDYDDGDVEETTTVRCRAR